MERRIHIVGIITIGLLAGAICHLCAQTLHKKSPTADRSTVRYAIVNNEVDRSQGVGDPERRFIEILIDSKSFTKKHLIEVFHLVSNRFPTPVLLYLNVATDLEDVPTPEERDRGGTSGQDDQETTSINDALRSVSKIARERNSAILIRRGDKPVLLIIHWVNGTNEEIELK